MFAFSSTVLTRFPLHERAGAAVNVGEEPRAAYPRRVAARPLVEIGKNEVTRSEANLEAKRLLKSKPSQAREPTASLPLSRPLFDARAAALLGRRCGGTPFVPTPPPRRGAQRRARGFSGDPAARSSAASRCGGSWGGTPLPGVSTGALRCVSRARAYAREFLDSWIQGFRVFKSLFSLVKTPRLLTDGGLVLTDGGRTPDRWGADP